MKISRLVTLIFIFFLPARSVRALDENRHVSQYAHAAWRIQDGFFSAPNTITQTTDGYIWIGTLNGLVRFDGVRFVPWMAPKGTALPDSRITSILGARDGSLWIGTVAGLSRLQNGELLNYSSIPIGISSVIEDPAGTIWVTRYGVRDGKGPLCRVDGRQLRCFNEHDGIPVNYGVGLSEDSFGNLWIGSYMLCRWKPGTAAITYFQEELKYLKGEPGVLDIAAGPNGSLWAATQGVGPKLGVQHYSDGKWRSYSVPGFDGSLVRAHTLFLDRDKTLWVGTEADGLYHIHNGTADHFRSANGLTGDSIAGFYQDREGNLWVATNGGVDFFRDTPVINYSMREGLSIDSVYSILASGDGSIWVANQGALDVIRNNEISSITHKQRLPGEDVSALLEDHKHRLWLGVDHKVVIYEQKKFQEVRKADGGEFRTDSKLFAVAEDTEQNIWIMTASHHLFRIQDQKVREEIPLNGLPLPNWLAADKTNGLWIGSFSDKLGHYHNRHLDIVTLQHSASSTFRNSKPAG